MEGIFAIDKEDVRSVKRMREYATTYMGTAFTHYHRERIVQKRKGPGNDLRLITINIQLSELGADDEKRYATKHR